VKAYDIAIDSTTDEQGWQYSFNFCHKFGPKEEKHTWVRRRYYTNKQWEKEKPTRVMECERFWWDTKAWDARFLCGGDFRYWTLDEKIKSTPLIIWPDQKINFKPLPRNFSNAGYCQEVGHLTDGEGWEYAAVFAGKFGPTHKLPWTWVRRRYWNKK